MDPKNSLPASVDKSVCSWFRQTDHDTINKVKSNLKKHLTLMCGLFRHVHKHSHVLTQENICKHTHTHTEFFEDTDLETKRLILLVCVFSVELIGSVYLLGLILF